MQRNRIFEGLITSVSEDGSGICRYDGYTVFVKNACVGDRCRIELTKENKTYGFGKIVEIITPSPHRISPPCKAFPACGGCTLLHTSYDAQLEIKRSIVANALSRLGGFEGVFVHEAIPSSPAFGYRNKSQYPVSGDSKNPKIGFYKAKSHGVSDVSVCLIENPDARLAVNAVRSWIKKYGVPPYDERSHGGLIRHIYFRAAETSMLVLVSRKKDVPHLSELRDSLLSLPLRAPLSGIVLNVNPKRTNTILGEEDYLIYGEKSISAKIGDISYIVSYQSFFQVNSFTTPLLYEKATELCALTGAETVFDLYCGIGTISLYLARKAKKVIGVEIVPEAVADARKNARLNNINNALFYVGAAEKICPELIKNGERADVVVVDPPRKGCDQRLLDAIGKMNPKRIVYVSCNAATLARDARYLSERFSYSLNEAFPVDQFPHTTHVETVVLLSKGEINSKKVRVEFSLEDMDMSGFREGATYGEIKAYVKEQTGLQVSSLYIAQVKQKCGIIERENYNKPKSENPKQPQCPPEKEKAIRAALKHFQMI